MAGGGASSGPRACRVKLRIGCPAPISRHGSPGPGRRWLAPQARNAAAVQLLSGRQAAWPRRLSSLRFEGIHKPRGGRKPCVDH